MRVERTKLPRWSAVLAAIGTSGMILAFPSIVTAAGSSVAIHEGPPGCSRPSYCYAPAFLTVPSGTKVTWTDDSDSPHTVTRCTASACNGAGPGSGADQLSSGQFSQGQSFSATLTAPGTYAYYCTVHGYAVMHGIVTVGGSTAASSNRGTPNTGSGAAGLPFAGVAGLLALVAWTLTGRRWLRRATTPAKRID